MKQAVMYGGGNIGRGFIGATLSQSGYEVTFIDVAEPVVKALQEKKQYPVRYVSSEGHEDVVIEHVTAVNGNDQEAASEAIANCDIMATAVGARILKFIVGNIVAGLRKRWARDDRPLNIIICENLMDANKVMEGMLKDLLTDEEKKHFDEKVGLVEASIGRMVPVQTEEMKDGDPMRVCVERYGFLPVDKAAFKGEIPEITNMVPFEPFDFYIKRKLYVHNMGHATCAYLGGYEGRKYIYQSIDDPEILNIVQNAMLESALALSKKYGVELDGLMLHITDLLGRFRNAALKPLIGLYAFWRKHHDGIEDTEIISGKELMRREPNLTPETKFAMYNPSAGCVCPYGLTIAYAENAVQNGAQVSLNTAVLSMEVSEHNIISVTTNRGVIHPKIVINAAGVFAEDIAAMADDRFFSIHPRRGTNSILDQKAGAYMHSVASVKDISVHGKTHSKGGGILHTVHDNLLVGPDAVETVEKENTETRAESIKTVFDKQTQTMPALSKRDIITYFTGVRAPTFEEDFILEPGRRTRNLIHVAGIQSPGLTTAPAVAVDMAELAVDMLGKTETVEKNNNYNPIRKGVPVLREMDDDTREKMIAENPDYGEIICRCEQISKGEILDALKSPICVPTVDGIKKRIRPGMGRCQGGFCSPLVTKIIAEFLGVPLYEVKKSSAEAVITYGETKVNEGGEE